MFTRGYFSCELKPPGCQFGASPGVATQEELGNCSGDKSRERNFGEDG